MGMKPDDLRYLVDSVFLHPKLPHEEEANRRSKENYLLRFVSSSATAFAALLGGTAAAANKNASRGWMRITHMLQTMASLHSSDVLSKKSVQSALLAMKKNGMTYVPHYGMFKC